MAVNILKVPSNQILFMVGNISAVGATSMHFLSLFLYVCILNNSKHAVKHFLFPDRIQHFTLSQSHLVKKSSFFFYFFLGFSTPILCGWFYNFLVALFPFLSTLSTFHCGFVPLELYF